jgi:hypothetical protein
MGFNAPHYVCSVSTCTRKRTGLVFCSTSCWEVHLPMMRHRDPWAVDARSPSREEWLREQAEEAKATAQKLAPQPAKAATPVLDGPLELSDDTPEEILVIASRLKEYVRARSGMNTSDAVLAPLSSVLRSFCDEAIRRAHAEGRKTVLERDVPRRGSR